jgi:hypothetical protein
MAYTIDMQLSPAHLVPCSIVASTATPGMYLQVLEDGSSVVVEPNGSQVRTIPAGQGNWDSPWTQAGLYGDKLVYRSSGGVPRGYLVIR